ncbi:hypothetical protein PM082_018376 [Marasmius tenuissimus]|nr:hypothetical protein PM082_018376 [Marasmius tenuissimus]
MEMFSTPHRTTAGGVTRSLRLSRRSSPYPNLSPDRRATPPPQPVPTRRTRSPIPPNSGAPTSVESGTSSNSPSTPTEEVDERPPGRESEVAGPDQGSGREEGDEHNGRDDFDDIARMAASGSRSGNDAVGAIGRVQIFEDEDASPSTIPKPPGEGGRPRGGGYNVECALKWPPGKYGEVYAFVKEQVKEHLDCNVPPSEQPKKLLDKIRDISVEKYRWLVQYKDVWPVYDIIRSCLKYQKSSDIKKRREAALAKILAQAQNPGQEEDVVAPKKVNRTRRHNA